MKKKIPHCLSLILFYLIITPSALANQLLTEQFAATPFYAIDINGPVNVQITAGQSKQSLQLTGDKNSLCHVYAAVKNDTLYLSMQPGFVANSNSKLMAKVNMRYLNSLRYTGSGDIAAANLTGPLNVIASGSGSINMVGKDIDLRNLVVTGSNNVNILGVNSNLLNIQDYGLGKVNLGGTMVLQQLAYSGAGSLSLYWVNSSSIKVTGNGGGRIFLAGITGLLDATISNRTYLDAKYLHARRAFVNTTNFARADVWTKCTLSALASDGSNIFYYNDPALVAASYMDPPGSVLRMTGIDSSHLPVPPKAC